MMIYQLFAILFLLVTPLAGFFFHRLFRLHKSVFKPNDLSLVLLAIQLVLVSDRLLPHSLLPYYTLLMSTLAIGVAGFLLLPLPFVREQPFTYGRFIKFFWRSGFIMTVICYIVMLVLIFLAP